MPPMTGYIRSTWAFVAIALATARLLGATDQRFQAAAHILVGGWFGAWAFGIHQRSQWAQCTRPGFYGWLGLGTSLVELYAFFVGIGRPAP